MTQPPSHQPPPGGFGAPQGPPPPEGPPPPQDTPPQQPPQGQAPPQGQTPPQGQAQPQAPSGPPNTPPAYGYPQGQPQPGPYGYPQGQPQPAYGQQPGPYGQQPGPYGQLPNPYGGGYPPQQYAGAPTLPPNAGNGGNGGGNKGFFKRRPGVVIAAVVAGLLVIGGVAWFALGDDNDGTTPVAHSSDDPKPTPTGSASVDQGDGNGTGRGEADLNAGRKPGDAKALWLQINNVDVPGDGADVFGPWVVGDTVVKAMYKQIVGYSVTDGKEKWSLPLSQPVCSAPTSPTADGELVIATRKSAGEAADCDQLQQIDLKTGQGGWKKEVPERGIFDMTLAVSMVTSGDVVTFSRTSYTDAFRVSDGKTLWGKIAGNCQPSAIMGGTPLIAAETCPSGTSDKLKGQLQGLDPLTGKASWTFPLKLGWQADKVFSVNPLVVSLKDQSDASAPKWGVLVLNQDGTKRTQLSGSDDQFWAADCGDLSFGDDSLEGCKGVAADANTLYLATKPTKKDINTNEIVAFNLNTGKPKWRTKLPSRELLPMRMEGGNVLAYVPATYGGKGGELVTVAPTGGAPKVLQKHPDSAAKVESGFYSPTYAYVDGRFFLVDPRVSGGGSDKDEMSVKTMMAFGQ